MTPYSSPADYPTPYKRYLGPAGNNGSDENVIKTIRCLRNKHHARLFDTESRFFSASRFFILFSAFLCAPFSLYASSNNGHLALSTGLDISSGDYGEEEDTEIVYLPVTIKYTAFPWTYKASFSFLSISGPASVVGGIDGGEIIDTDSNEERTVSGAGDIILSTAWALDTLWNANVYADLVGKIKVPYADEDEGLGTGKTDVQIQLDLAASYGKFTPLATIGYKWPGYESFDDQTILSLGGDYKITDQNNMGAFYDFREASSSSSDHLSEVMVYLNHKFNKTYSINTYLVTGFSDSSLDKGIGLQFTVRQ